MLKIGPHKTIGTPIRCPTCHYRNMAIDIWCERCGAPLDWKREGAAEEPTVLRAVVPAPSPTSGPAPASGPTRRPHPSFALPKLTKPAWLTARPIPRLSLPRPTMAQVRAPAIPRMVVVVGVVLAVLLIVPLIYVFAPSSRSATSPPGTVPAVKAGSPQAAAVAAVEAKTGLKYSSRCTNTAACLSIAGQTMGTNAAAIVFRTAQSGGRQCVAYVYQKNGWHSQDVACALPGQVSPLVGHDATVHVPGNCANVRDSASLNARVVGCLHDGSTVRVDSGPVYADDFIWWHTDKGWMAHDFLVAP